MSAAHGRGAFGYNCNARRSDDEDSVSCRLEAGHPGGHRGKRLVAGREVFESFSEAVAGTERVPLPALQIMVSLVDTLERLRFSLDDRGHEPRAAPVGLTITSGGYSPETDAAFRAVAKIVVVAASALARPDGAVPDDKRPAPKPTYASQEDYWSERVVDPKVNSADAQNQLGVDYACSLMSRIEAVHRDSLAGGETVVIGQVAIKGDQRGGVVSARVEPLPSDDARDGLCFFKSNHDKRRYGPGTMVVFGPWWQTVIDESARINAEQLALYNRETAERVAERQREIDTVLAAARVFEARARKQGEP